MVFTVFSQEELLKIFNKEKFCLEKENDKIIVTVDKSFFFKKNDNKKISIIPDDFTPEINFSQLEIYSFDLLKMKEKYIEKNTNLFTNLYFLIAPILSIPLFAHFPTININSGKLSQYQILSILYTKFNIENIKNKKSNCPNIIEINETIKSNKITVYYVKCNSFCSYTDYFYNTRILRFEKVHSKNRLIILEHNSNSNELIISDYFNNDLFNKIKNSDNSIIEVYIDPKYLFILCELNENDIDYYKLSKNILNIIGNNIVNI
jgi:hypothetical protein